MTSLSIVSIIAMISSAVGIVLGLAMTLLVLWQAPRQRTNQLLALYMITVIAWGVVAFVAHFWGTFGENLPLAWLVNSLILARSFNALLLFALVTHYVGLWSNRWVQAILVASLIHRFFILIPLLVQETLFTRFVFWPSGRISFQTEPLGYATLLLGLLYHLGALGILWRYYQKRVKPLLSGTLILLVGILITPTVLGQYSLVIMLAAVAGVFFTYAILHENLFNPLVQANEALRQQKAQLAEAQRIARLGSWYWEIETNELTWNQQLFELLGLPSSTQPTLQLFLEMIHPDDLENVVQNVQNALVTGASGYTTECRIVQGSGLARVMAATTHIHRNSAGQPLQLLGVIQDITAQKEVAAALARARDQALAASRLKSELLAKVSHELRTPLSAIMGYTDLLQMDVFGPVTAEQHQTFDKIITSTQYLADLVEELLTQAQLESGKLQLITQPFELAKLVEAVQAKLGVLAQHKDLALTVQIDEAVPSRLCGDAGRVQQILINLVSNAIKFTDAGHVQVRLYRPDADHWAMEVADSGPGIPAEAQAQIFEPFGQVDGSQTRKHRGTGLGLAIVDQLTALMGGQITLDSQVGLGAVFTIFLPLILPKECDHPNGTAPGCKSVT